MSSEAEVERALEVVRAAGYVTLREKSYRQAQERQRVAEAQADWAKADVECSRQWARNCLNEERRLRERLTYVWGIAVKFGATLDDLRDTIADLPAEATS